MAHSIAVLAEGSDYLVDAAGAGMALLAIRLSASVEHQPSGLPQSRRKPGIRAFWKPDLDETI
jgi:hypothetical protein